MIKRISILGAGESGLGAALLAQQKGYAVWISEKGSISDDKRQVLIKNQIPFEEGGHSLEKILTADEIIKSPGISPKTDIVQLAIERGIPVIDELEFASRFSKGKVIAITGTNGKTTTTLLTYHLLKKGGLNVGLAGNVGKSWAGHLVEQDHDWWVLETSSFQIDGFVTLKPSIAILTNITPDHLDRYDYQLENYVSSKLSLFDAMDANGHIIYFADDELVAQALHRSLLKSELHGVSLSTKQINGAYTHGDKVVLEIDKVGRYELGIENWVLKGMHNVLNSSFASIAALLAGVDLEVVKTGLADFQNAPHRMEQVGIIDGVSFVNDSKGTNVDATIYALQAYENPLIWIAGGVDKGNDYSVLLPLIKGKVNTLICLGIENEKLKNAFQGHIPNIVESQNITEVVKIAKEMAQSGDVVLLSPACASFDLFKNYEDRGDQFRNAVHQLKLTVEQ